MADRLDDVELHDCAGQQPQRPARMARRRVTGGDGEQFLFLLRAEDRRARGRDRLLAGWSAATPPEFTFTLKAPRRITHDARLRGCDDLVATFCEAARTLGSKLAVLLFQLPPSLKKDLPLIDAFLSSLPGDLRAAFEFRHASWHDDAVFDRLRAQGAALCIADSEKLTTPAVATAPHGYFRLRDEGYDDADLAHWAGTMQGEAGWQDVFVYFKHEAAGRGPALATQLVEILSAT